MKTQPTQTNCPNCGSSEGYVRGVKVAAGNEYTLTYTCADCRHRWEGEPHIRPSAIARWAPAPPLVAKTG